MGTSALRWEGPSVSRPRTVDAEAETRPNSAGRITGQSNYGATISVCVSTHSAVVPWATCVGRSQGPMVTT